MKHLIFPTTKGHVEVVNELLPGHSRQGFVETMATMKGHAEVVNALLARHI